jgi:SOUL heme-binding protein
MTEQQSYQVISKYPGFELRRYPAHVVAEVAMSGEFERAGNAGFGPLVSYISGRNQSGQKIAMTAPVVQETVQPDAHLVAFVMPADATVDDLPQPATDRVRVHEVAESLAAVATYSGRWTEASYLRHVKELRDAVDAAGLTVNGRPRYARFDPPWKPPFLRRNEVVIPVAA